MKKFKVTLERNGMKVSATVKAETYAEAHAKVEALFKAYFDKPPVTVGKNFTSVSQPQC